MISNDDNTLLFKQVDEFASQLYDEADPDRLQASTSESAEQICPMFDSLRRVSNRYQAAELIGTGAMKEVFRVFDAQAERHVALARLQPKFSQDYFDAFLREARLTARLQHSSIIRLLDIGIDAEERPFFTMEFKRGLTLRQVLRDLSKNKELKKDSLHQRIVIFERICEAVAYAHSCRVLHLDLKPENIQVGDFGEVQVCDWGLGVLIPSGAEETDMEALLDLDLYGSLNDTNAGTPIYMAPEQADRLQPRTPQMDIYALGCILEELVTLKIPTGTTHECPHQVSALRAMLSKATHNNPQKRYQSVAALGEDVGRYLAGYSTKAETSNFFHELALFYGRNQLPCRVIIVSFAILSLSATLFTIQLNKRKDEAEQALNLYLKTQKVSDDRLKIQSREAKHLVSAMTHPALLSGAITKPLVDHLINQVDVVLANNPPPSSGAWQQKFWLSFLTLDLQTAIDVSNPEILEVDDLIPLAKKYALRQGSNQYLSCDDFIELLEELSLSPKNRQPLIERMLLYDQTLNRPIADRLKIMESVLRSINPEWRQSTIHYEPNTKLIKLRGAGLKRFVFPKSVPRPGLCLLRMLNPLSLDLQTTAIVNLSELSGLDLVELDLRKTPVKSLCFDKMRSLHSVIIEPGQFTSQVINQLPQHIKVVEIPNTQDNNTQSIY